MAELKAEARPALRSSDLVSREILRGLYEGRYAAGQRLLEPDLVRRCGVSRGSVREALQRLAALGVVTLAPFRGAEIRRLTRSEAEGILRVVEPLVGLACRLAAERAAAGHDMAPFRAAVAGLFEHEHEPATYEQIRARNRFYRVLIETGGNAELARILPGLNIHLVRARLREGPPDKRAEAFRDYRQIADAVLAGDAAAADKAGRRHVQRQSTILKALPEAAFARDAGPAGAG
jgi:DNA-binding GntR family transcriptional regulator